MVAAARPITSRDDLRTPPVDVVVGRETWSAGTSAEPVRWRDTRADLARRAALWRQALESGGLQSGDRVMLALPPRWAVGGDCLLALLDAHLLVALVDDPVTAPDFDATVVIVTPTDALRLAHADRSPRLQRVFVTGEPGGSIPSTRRAIEEHLGARCTDVYALTELGVVGWSCPKSATDLHLDEEAFDISSSGGAPAEPMSDAHAVVMSDARPYAELLLSTRAQRDVMLHRYPTGDLVHLDRSACACGSAWVRARGGILGRTTEVLAPRGRSLLPTDIEDIVRRHPAVFDFAILTYPSGEVSIELDPAPAVASETDRARVAAEVSEDLKRSLGVRLQCDVAPPGTLAAPDANRRARRLIRQ